MTSLAKQVVVPDGGELDGDLRDPSLVESVLRALSKQGCIVIKDAVSNLSDPDDPEIARNEVWDDEQGLLSPIKFLITFAGDYVDPASCPVTWKICCSWSREIHDRRE
jgi:hypothetical protein